MAPEQKQRDIFLGGEGDSWFRRNVQTLDSRDDFGDVNVFLPLVPSQARVLEIGCAYGKKLAYLGEKCPRSALSGIDPSSAAIEEGRRRFPDIDFRIGTSDRLEFPDDSFDVVVLGSCLYLVDRSDLFRTIAEVDRVTRSGGMVCITDFDVAVPCSNAYSHKHGVRSYKNTYARFFTGGGHYSLIRKVSHPPASPEFGPHADDRFATSVLHKENLTEVYRACVATLGTVSGIEAGPDSR